MVLAKILSSYAFRYAVGAVIVLSMVVMLVMIIVYGVFSYNYFHDVHDGISAELQEVTKTYELGGIQGLNDFIDQRGKRFNLTQFAYVLVDKNQNKLAGDLDDWPSFRQYGDGWLSFELGILQRDGDSREQEFVARSTQLADGNQLLVARSYERVLGYIRFVAGVLLRGFIVTVSMGVVGAFFISWGVQRRLDTINRSIRTIMAGDLSERLKITDSPSEIEQLAVNLNEMLDRIQYLMDGVKQVSDNIAHDLRTPLTRLRNQLVQFENKCSDSDVEIVQQLTAETDEMLATFNALLRIARIELGESRTEQTTLRLNSLVADVVELYDPLAGEKQIELRINMEPVFIRADRNMLFQVVANVLDNAIKYTPSGGHVCINTEVELAEVDRFSFGLSEKANDNVSDKVRLTIADTGCGIAPKNRDKVFRRFYREESSRGIQPGNGLGLSLVAAVMKLHKATVTLADNQPGLKVSMLFERASAVSLTDLSDQGLDKVNADVSISAAS